MADRNISHNYIFNPVIASKINDKVFDDIYIPSFIYTILLMIIGVIGNIIVFYVYFTRWRKTTSRVFILALAAFDLINGFFTTPTEIYFMLKWFQTSNAVLCKSSRFLTFMMNNCSSFTLLGIAVDRYISICRPLETQMSPKRAKIIVFVGIFVAVIFAWPALVVYGIQSIPVPISNTTSVVGSMCMIENSFVHSIYPLVFTGVLLCGNLLIDVTLIILYSLIAVQVLKRGSFLCDSSANKSLRKESMSTSNTEDVFIDDMKEPGKKSPSILAKFSKRYGSSSEKSDLEVEMAELNKDKKTSPKKQPSISAAVKRNNFRRQRSMSIQSEEARRVRMMKVTLMLFMVTLLFMISFIPYCVIVIIRYTNKMHYLSLSTSGKAFYHFILRSYLLSMSMNPIIYSFMSEKFREECKYSFKKFTQFILKRDF